MEPNLLLANSAPLDHFLGLSTIEMHHLIAEPFGANSPIQFCEEINDNILDQIPLFLLAEELIEIIQHEKVLQLSVVGSLPEKVLLELYSKRFILDENLENGTNQLKQEDDFVALKITRLLLEKIGFLENTKNELRISEGLSKLISSKQRVQIFKHLFQAFTSELSWGNYDDCLDKSVGQMGWGFTIIMLDKFGDQARNIDFYADKYSRAFPIFTNSIFRPALLKSEYELLVYYAQRTFERFLFWFGLVAINNSNEVFSIEYGLFVRTEVLYGVFHIDESMNTGKS